MKTALSLFNELFSACPHNSTVCTDCAVALIEADRREVRSAALRDALEKVESCHSIYRRTPDSFDSWASLKKQLRYKIEEAAR